MRPNRGPPHPRRSTDRDGPDGAPVRCGAVGRGAGPAHAGGVPIGAILATEDVERAFQGSHNSTFGGNPLACAAATAAIEYTVRERLWERADRLGIIGVEKLRGLEAPSVREIRGLGLMIGIELRGKAAPV